MSQPTNGKHIEVFNMSKDPIKHYVRINGWLTVAEKRIALIQEKSYERKYGLRYFTLPGRDSIDIYLFSEASLISHDGRGFPSVYFCEYLRANYTEIKNYLGRTKGAKDSFENLMRQGSFIAKIRREPFDVINLDFSGVCFPPQDEPFSPTLKAIYQLIEYQKGHEFDLFITFRAEKTEDNQDAIDTLCQNMNDNFNENEEIESIFKEKFEEQTPEELVENDYGLFLLTTFPKIIFGYGSTHNFVVTCSQKYIYKREKHGRRRETYQIIKFLFTFCSLNPVEFSDAPKIAARCMEEYHKSVESDLKNEVTDVDTIFEAKENLSSEYEEMCLALLQSRKPFGTE